MFSVASVLQRRKELVAQRTKVQAEQQSARNAYYRSESIKNSIHPQYQNAIVRFREARARLKIAPWDGRLVDANADAEAKFLELRAKYRQEKSTSELANIEKQNLDRELLVIDKQIKNNKKLLARSVILLIVFFISIILVIVAVLVFFISIERYCTITLTKDSLQPVSGRIGMFDWLFGEETKTPTNEANFALGFCGGRQFIYAVLFVFAPVSILYISLNRGFDGGLRSVAGGGDVPESKGLIGLLNGLTPELTAAIAATAGTVAVTNAQLSPVALSEKDLDLISSSIANTVGKRIEDGIEVGLSKDAKNYINKRIAYSESAVLSSIFKDDPKTIRELIYKDIIEQKEDVEQKFDRYSIENFDYIYLKENSSIQDSIDFVRNDIMNAKIEEFSWIFGSEAANSYETQQGDGDVSESAQPPVLEKGIYLSLDEAIGAVSKSVGYSNNLMRFYLDENPPERIDTDAQFNDIELQSIVRSVEETTDDLCRLAKALQVRQEAVLSEGRAARVERCIALKIRKRNFFGGVRDAVFPSAQDNRWYVEDCEQEVPRDDRDVASNDMIRSNIGKRTYGDNASPWERLANGGSNGVSGVSGVEDGVVFNSLVAEVCR